MKKTLLLLVLAPPAALAQVTAPSIVAVSTSPAGLSCSANLPIKLKTPDGTLFTCQNGIYASVGGGSSSGGVVPTNICTAAGMKCDGATDDTTAFQALLNTTSAAGGGVLQGPAGKTSLILGQITILSAATTPWKMAPIRIAGSNQSFGASNLPTPVPPGKPFILDMRFNGSRILSLGLGTLEIDHLTVINGGTSCGTFLQTTLTNVNLHDNAILGNTAAGGVNSCDDVWLAGGTNGTDQGLNGSINDYFQGYGSEVRHNFADYIRTFLIGRVAFNSIPIVDNEVGINSGSNVTTAVTAATNATAAVLTSTGHNFPVGTGVTLTFSGFTGNWTPLNGAQAITVIDANTFSVAINSTAFGALTGSPVYLSGSAFTIDGTATVGANFTNSGNFLSGNLIEQTNYPFAYKLGISAGNHIGGTSCWDATTVSIACVWQQSTAASNFIQINHTGGIGVLSQTGATANSSMVFVAGQLLSALSIVPSGTGTTTPVTAIQSGLGTGNQVRAELGANFSNFNAGYTFFQYQGGAGSPSNRFGLALPGQTGGGSYTDGASLFHSAGYVVSGTAFSASGCSNTANFGGNTAGIFTSGTTGTCTVVITPGLTAVHGWACTANDLTTPADIIAQTAESATTFTLSGTTTTGDQINFSCTGF